MSQTIIAAKIKKIRIKLNLSQERFGKKIGLSGKTISAYERGLCEPPLRIIERISQIFSENFIAIESKQLQYIAEKLNIAKNLLHDLENSLLE